jgi:hypothetical protein
MQSIAEKKFLDDNVKIRENIISHLLDEDSRAEKFLRSIDPTSVDDPGRIIDLIKWRLFGDGGYQGDRLISMQAFNRVFKRSVFGKIEWSKAAPDEHAFYLALFSEVTKMGSIDECEKNKGQFFSALKKLKSHQDFSKNLSKCLRLTQGAFLIYCLEHKEHRGWIYQQFSELNGFAKAKVMNALLVLSQKESKEIKDISLFIKEAIFKILESDKGLAVREFLSYFSSAFWVDDNPYFPDELRVAIFEKVKKMVEAGDIQMLSIFSNSVNFEHRPKWRNKVDQLIKEYIRSVKKRSLSGKHYLDWHEARALFRASRLVLNRGLSLWALNHNMPFWGDLIEEADNKPELLKLMRHLLIIRYNKMVGLIKNRLVNDPVIQVFENQVLPWINYKSWFVLFNVLVSIGLGISIGSVQTGFLWAGFVVASQLIAQSFRFIQDQLLDGKYSEWVNIAMQFTYLDEALSLLSLVAGAWWLCSAALLQWVACYGMFSMCIYYPLLQNHIDSKLNAEITGYSNEKNSTLLTDGSKKFVHRERSNSLSEPSQSSKKPQ